MNTKTEVFWHKNRKTDLKDSQNCKTEIPMSPPLNYELDEVTSDFANVLGVVVCLFMGFWRVGTSRRPTTQKL